MRDGRENGGAGGAFDGAAEEYDQWYECPEGNAIFRAERDCLLSLYGGPFDSWLEIGLGTGRFAHALGIAVGVDPSPNMLAIAARRGVEGCAGIGERLPFRTSRFDGALIALTLCFVADARHVFEECCRILRPGGHLLLGIVPLDSAWGRAYAAKAASGHPLYRYGHFRTVDETAGLAQSAGFEVAGSAATLFWGPEEGPEPVPRIEAPHDGKAGFVALLLERRL